MLPVPNPGAEHSATAQPRTCIAAGRERRLVALRQVHPVTDKFFNPYRQAEVRGEQCHQPVAVAHLPAEQTGEEQLGEISDLITLAHLAAGQPFERADINAEPVIVRPVQADCRTRLCPSTVKEQQKAMVEHIEKAHERRIPRV